MEGKYGWEDEEENGAEGRQEHCEGDEEENREQHGYSFGESLCLCVKPCHKGILIAGGPGTCTLDLDQGRRTAVYLLFSYSPQMATGRAENRLVEPTFIFTSIMVMSYRICDV